MYLLICIRCPINSNLKFLLRLHTTSTYEHLFHLVYQHRTEHVTTELESVWLR